MSITVGSRIGPYEILSLIGAGGMGEVFKARDTRLDRSVAIKVLPAEFAGDPKRKLRFEREAKTISQFNHPHICTLHDVGENYLVMELLEGETVAGRLASGPMPMRDVIRYGAQIADALGLAHRAGIIHRDLKPANVMLTKSGAKLLDFGLAKPQRAMVDVDGPTQHKPLTGEGTIAGTFQYMAPEQLEGAEADARTDLFALGALLYEMATGKRAFEGKTKTSLIAAIVGADPVPMTQLQPMTPPAFEHVVMRCLAKNPDDRWQSAHDVADELRWIGEIGSQSGAASAVPAGHRGRNLLIASIAALIVAAAAIAAMVMTRELREARQPIVSELNPPDDFQLDTVLAGAMAISPDGSRLAFTASGEKQRAIWIRDLGTGSMRPLDGTSLALFPFWSPDGRSIGYFAEDKLMVVDLASGAKREVCDAPQGRGGSWSPRGVIVFAPNIFGGLDQVEAAGGGKVTPVTRVRDDLASHRNPIVLPDGTHFLYVERLRAMEAGSIVAGSLDDPGFRKVVVTNASNAVYAAGMLLYRRGDDVVAQPFDTRKLAVHGRVATVAESVEYYNPRDLANFSASSNGRFVYRAIDRTPVQMVILDANGREIKTIGEPAEFTNLLFSSVSPDGRFFVSARRASAGTRLDLWVTDLQRGTSNRLTSLSSSYLVGAISPDATRVAVSESSGKMSTLAIYPLAGGTPRIVLRNAGALVARSWTPDGRLIVCSVQTAETGMDVVTIDPASGSIQTILNAPRNQIRPKVSPNGKWLLFGTDGSGRYELMVTSFPRPDRQWQVSTISTISTQSFLWTPKGDAILFVADRTLYSVRVRETANGLDLGTPEKLPVDVRNYDVLPLPGGQWLTFRSASDERPDPVRLIVNWTSLIQR